MKKTMKYTLWVFLFIGIIIIVLLYLRKRKGELTLATGIIEPELETKPEKELIPGTDIPVGLRPRPGNNLLGFLSPFDRRILGL